MPDKELDAFIRNAQRVYSDKLKENPITEQPVFNMPLVQGQGSSQYDYGFKYPGADLDLARFRRQSFADSFGNVAVKQIPKIVLSTLENLGGTFDFEDYANQDTEIGNDLVRWANRQKQSLDQNFPVYQDPTKEGFMDNIGSWSYWLNAGSDLQASIAGFVGSGALVGAVTEGVGSLATIAKIPQFLQKIGFTARQVGKMGSITKNLANAIANTQAESIVSATQVYDNTYNQKFQELKSQGIDDYSADREAREFAALAGATTINVNRANVLLNLTSSARFLKPSMVTRNLINLPSTKKVLSTIGAESLQEAAEEYINLVAEKKGTAVGKQEYYGLENALTDLFSEEAFESMLLGAIGGAGQTTLQNITNRSKFNPLTREKAYDEQGNFTGYISQYKARQRAFEDQQREIEDLENVFSQSKQQGIVDLVNDASKRYDLLNKISNLEKEGKFKEADDLRKFSLAYQAFRAFETGTTEKLYEMYNGLKDQYVDAGASEEQIQTINSNIDFVKSLEKDYDRASNYENSEDVFYNRVQRKMALEQRGLVSQSLNNSKSELLSKVSEIADRYYYTNPETGEPLPLVFNINNLEHNTGLTPEQQKLYDKFFKKVQTLEEYQDVKELQDVVDSYNTYIEKIDDSYGEITKSSYQESVKSRKTIAKEMNKAISNGFKNYSVQQLNNLLTDSRYESYEGEIRDAIADKSSINNINEKAKSAKAREQSKKLTKENITPEIKEDIVESQNISNRKQLAENIETNLNGYIETLSKELGRTPAFDDVAQALSEDIPERFNEEMYNTVQAQFIMQNPNHIWTPYETFTTVTPEEKTAQQIDENNSLTDIPKDMTTSETNELSEGDIDTIEEELLERNYIATKLGVNNIATLHRNYEQRTSSEGNITIVFRDDLNNELNSEGALTLLDFDKYKPGTTVNLIPDFDYAGKVYDPTKDNISNKTVEWNDLKERLTPEQLVEEIPVKILDNEGNLLGYLHTVSWHKETSLDTGTEEIKRQQRNSRLIRQYIVDNNGYSTTISDYKTGTLFLTKDKSPISTTEAMPDPNLNIAVYKSGSLGRGDKKFDDNLLNQNLREGQPYAVVPLSSDQNLAIPLISNKITAEQARSITLGIKAWYNNDQKVINEVKALTGGRLDLGNLQDIKEFLGYYVYSVKLSTGQNIDSYLKKLSTKAEGRPFLAVSGNSIEFGIPTSYGPLNLTGSKDFNSIVFTKNFKLSPERFDELLNKMEQHLTGMYFSVDAGIIGIDKLVVPVISDAGVNVGNEDLSYDSWIKQNTTTNVLGREYSPGKYTYTIQPTVRLNFDNIIKEEPSVISQEVPEDLIPSQEFEEIPVSLQVKLNHLFDFEDELIDTDFNKVSEDADRFLIKNFSFNQQRELVKEISKTILRKSIEEGKVSQKDIISEELLNVERYLLDIIEEINTSNIDPARKTLLIEKTNKKIDSLRNSRDIVNRRVTEELALINNLKITKDPVYNQENDEGFVIDDNTAERTDFSDEYSITQDSKQTAGAQIKRFLSFIPDLDNKTGLPKKTWFGTDKYYDLDSAFNKLHQILSGSKPDIEEQINTLETYLIDNTSSDGSIPNRWIEAVVSNLREADEQVKNQFASEMAKHNIKSQFIMWSRRPKYKGNKLIGYEFTHTVYADNSNDDAVVLEQEWKDNLVSGFITSLIDSTEEGYSINKDIAQSLTTAFTDLQEFIDNNRPSEDFKDKLKSYLSGFGIEISEETLDYIIKGKFKYKGDKKPLSIKEMFNSKKGLFNILNSKLQEQLELSDTPVISLLEDSAIKALARIEGLFQSRVFSNSYRVGSKTVYTFSNNKYAINRARDLYEDNELRNKLLHTIFAKDSDWLKDLNNPDSKFREWFDVGYISLRAIKKRGTSERDNQKLSQIQEPDHEHTKIGHFFGNVSTIKIAGETVRKANYFFPTMSDKTTMLVQSASAIQVTLENGQITDKVVNTLYEQCVLPEINRMIALKDIEPNLSNAFNKAKNIFFLIPELNEVTIGDKTLTDAILDNSFVNPEWKDKIFDTIRNRVNYEVSSKIAYWNSAGIGLPIEGSESFTYLPAEYFNKYAKESTVNYAATDMVVNYMLANANMYMLYFGDPALYYKESKESNVTVLDHVQETMNNMGKRHASEIAPGIEIADNNNKYRQLILKDRTESSSRFEYILKLLDNKTVGQWNSMSSEEKKKLKSYPYSKIDIADAQEFTSPEEHLYVMFKKGDLNKEDYKNALSLVKRNKALPKDLISKVLQPMKPVYVDNVFEQVGQDAYIEKRVYIKSSSFPLLPQLTKGLQIDELRRFMKDKGIARASFTTAVKVGITKEVLDIYDKEGNIKSVKDLAKIYNQDTQSLVLNRKGFRIQQEIPTKNKQFINTGTQERKLLFNNLLDMSGFKFGGKSYTGKQLQEIYDDTWKQVFDLARNEFNKEFLSEDNTVDIKKLQRLLIEEAEQRGFSYNDKDGLSVTTNQYGKTEFKIPLWINPQSSKYQNLVNALVNNRIVKQLMPGSSYVLGSETGFKSTDELTSLDNIVFTDSWNGELQTASPENNYTYQVLVPAKIFNYKGKKYDISKFTKRQDGKVIIDSNKLPSELLTIFGFRIPTQDLMSMAKIEIVGFLPESSGDLIIAPKDFITKMGSDFDIDKLYTYIYALEIDDAGNAFKLDNINSEDPKIKELSLKNKIIDIHHSVFSNSKAQPLITQPIGFGKLPDWATRISEKTKQTEVLPESILSSEYQRKKFVTGVSGKAGVGQFSLDSTFNSQLQGKDVFLRNPLGKEFTLQFGPVLSVGDLSENATITDSKRNKSDVIAAYQSASVDNEKERILEKLNINNITIPIIKILNQLGFDEDLVIPFINQDSIREYVSELSRVNSQLSEFIADKEQFAFDKVIQRYKGDLNIDIEILDEYSNFIQFEDSTIEELSEFMFSMINNPDSPSYNLYQLALLKRFFDLRLEGRLITKAQTAFNTDSSGIPPSVFEVNSKIRGVGEILTSSRFHNIDKMLGDVFISDKDTTKEEISRLYGAGYTSLYGDNDTSIMINPKTIIGHATVYGLIKAAELNFDLFPVYYTEQFNQLVNEIANITTTELDSELKLAEFKREVSQVMNSFLFTNSSLTGRDASEYRKELTIDSATNKSLATILYSIKNSNDKKLKEYFLTNSFLSLLSINPNNKGEFSTITFQASTGDNLDKNLPFLGLVSMLQNDKTDLGTYNGVQYTPRLLAEKLIDYSLLEGGIQEATQFIKYIPNTYLSNSQFGTYFRNLNNNFNIPILPFFTYYYVSPLTVQYAQTYPETVPTPEIDYINFLSGNSLLNTNSFTLNTKGIENLGGPQLVEGKIKPNQPPVFLSYKVSKDKYRLFQWDGKKYVPLDTIGQFNMKEYNADVYSVKSAIQSNNESTKTDSATQQSFKLKNTDSEGIKNLLEDIQSTSTNPFYQNLSAILNQNFDKLPDLKLATFDSNTPSGGFTYDTGTLRVSNTPVRELTERALLHELLHAYTGYKIYAYEYQTGKTKRVPESVKSITLSKEDRISIKSLETLKDKLQKELLLNPETSFQFRNTINKYYNYLIENNKSEEAQEFKNRIKESLSIDVTQDNNELTQEEVSKFYGALSTTEFVTMALTDPEFQQLLNSTPYNETQSFLDKLLGIVSKIVKSLGFDVNENSILAPTIDNIFRLIENPEIETQESVDSNVDTTSDINTIINNYNNLSDDVVSELIRNCE